MINGPILGVDPLSFTLIGLGAAAAVAASALVVRGHDGDHPRARQAATAAIGVDVAAVTALGLLAGGAHTHLSTLLLLIVALTGLRLERAPVLVATLACTAGYLVLAVLGEQPERVDRALVYLSVLWMLGLTAWGTVASHAWLTRVALERQAAQLALERAVGSCFSPQVAELLLRAPDGPPRTEGPLTVASVALDGLDALAAEDPAAAFAAADAYLAGLTEAALACDGTVDLGPGGALTVVFNAPLPQADHRALGLRCAAAMHASAARVSRRRARVGDPSLRLRVGLCTGRGAAGLIGSDLRRQYALLGEALREAAALAQLAVPGETWISHPSAAELAALGAHAEELRLPGAPSPLPVARARASAGPTAPPEPPSHRGGEPEDQRDQR